MKPKTRFIKDEYGYHTYIECLCSDFHHVSKLSFFYDNDDSTKSFYLEFKASAFPYPDEKGRKPYIWLKQFLFYFKNIWWAIKGRPTKYHSLAYWEFEEAQQICDFITYCIEKYSNK